MNPQSLEMFQALMLVFMSKEVRTPAIFIHGSPIKSEELDRALVESIDRMLFTVPVEKIIINGLSDKECVKSNVAYCGAETMKNRLCDEYVCIERENLLCIPPSRHTAAECREVIKMMKENGWDSITVATFPHHILRVMLQWVYCLKEAGVNFKVYHRTIGEVDWNQPAVKPILGGGTEEGTLFDHIAGEYERIVRYGNPEGQDEKGKFTPNATLKELIEYLRNRDQVPQPA